MNKLLLLSGNDLPFVGGKINIHQPRLKDIAFLGEDIFYLGANFLCFSKDRLEEQDKINLTNKTNFDVLMSIINNKTDITIKQSILSAELVLSMLFPQYQLMKMPTMLVLTKETEQGKEQCWINNDNFEQFKSIVSQMFCLNTFQSQDYNPANKLAEQIANKLRERHKKLNQKEDGQKSISILSRYVSILTLANHHTIPELMQYTVYQLFDQFKRFEKKYNYQIWLKAKLAGAQNLQDTDNWLGEDNQISSNQPKLNSKNRIELS